MAPKLKHATTDPSLADLLIAHKKDISLTLNCHAIAIVQSFNADKQTVTATMAYKKTFFEKQADGTYAPVLVDYPILVDCPVHILGGGKAHLTMPIDKGDECLICFNDRDLDNWYSGAVAGQVATGRLHSFADAIAIVGLHSLANLIEDYDTTRATLRWKNGAMVAVSQTQVKIANQIESLNAILQDLIIVLSGLYTIPTVPLVPATLDPAVIAALQAIAVRLGVLLE